MPSFLARIQKLDTSSSPPAQPKLEPRRTRRERARVAAKANRSVGAAAVHPSSKINLSASSKEKRKAG